MANKNIVCLVDDDTRVHLGWHTTLESNVELIVCKNCLELINQLSYFRKLPKISCVILGGTSFSGEIKEKEQLLLKELRQLVSCPLLINWQGYIRKDYLESIFDGRIYSRYGVKWPTLRLRIKKAIQEKSYTFVQKKKMISFRSIPQNSRRERCQQLLKDMALRSSGHHRKKIEYYAIHDPETGKALLEAIYNRLVTYRERPSHCPSHYINSSPVVAANILREILIL